jgi:hypothetical protein
MARNAHTWQSKYTQAEKDAAVRAYTVTDMSAPQVAEAAARGELEGAGRFTISPVYIRRLAKAAQASYTPERLAQPGEAARAIEAAQTRMLAYILAELRKWEAKARTGHVDWPEHGRILKALQAHGQAVKPRGRTAQTGQDDNENPDPQDSADAILAALLRRSNGDGNGQQNEGTEPASLSRAVSPGNTG